MAADSAAAQGASGPRSRPPLRRRAGQGSCPAAPGAQNGLRAILCAPSGPACGRPSALCGPPGRSRGRRTRARAALCSPPTPRRPCASRQGQGLQDIPLALAAAHTSPAPFRCVAALRGGGHGPGKGTPAQVPPPAPRRAKDKVKGQGQGKILKGTCNALNGHSGAK